MLPILPVIALHVSINKGNKGPTEAAIAFNTAHGNPSLIFLTVLKDVLFLI